jgi:hypothetical protein
MTKTDAEEMYELARDLFQGEYSHYRREAWMRYSSNPTPEAWDEFLRKNEELYAHYIEYRDVLWDRMEDLLKRA